MSIHYRVTAQHPSEPTEELPNQFETVVQAAYWAAKLVRFGKMHTANVNKWQDDQFVSTCFRYASSNADEQSKARADQVIEV